MQRLSPSTSEMTRIEVNVSEFARGEIGVKLRRDNTILVHALHLDQFAEDNFFRKELVKSFPVPSGADLEKIRSVIRSNGVLTIDIPMLRDHEATRRSHEQLLKTIDEPRQKKNDFNRSSSHVDVANLNESRLSAVPKRTSSLAQMENRPTFNIAEFLQSKFRPSFSPNGKKIILRSETRGFDPDELSIRLLDETLIVQGKKKGTSNQDKFFNERVRLPDGIDKFNVTSQLTEDGILFIEIPLINSVSNR